MGNEGFCDECWVGKYNASLFDTGSGGIQELVLFSMDRILDHTFLWWYCC